MLEKCVFLTQKGKWWWLIGVHLVKQSRKWFLIRSSCHINNNNSHEVTKQSLSSKYGRGIIGPERHYQWECSVFVWFTISEQFKQLCTINLNAWNVLLVHWSIFSTLVSIVWNTLVGEIRNRNRLNLFYWYLKVISPLMNASVWMINCPLDNAQVFYALCFDYEAFNGVLPPLFEFSLQFRHPPKRID